MKKIMIGTPTYDGKLSAQHVHCLLSTIIEGRNSEYNIFPVHLCNEAILQFARNDLFEMAHSSDIDELVFIDADILWNTEDFFKLLSHKEDIVGGVYPKKSDFELYPVRILKGENKLKINEQGLTEVEGVGFGFLKISKNAINKIWDNSEKYIQNNKEKRNVFKLEKINDDLFSEDISFNKLCADLGIKTYIDIDIICAHEGKKMYMGDFRKWLLKNNLLEV